MFFRLFFVVFYLTVTANGQDEEGDSCFKAGVQGVCTKIQDCSSAMTEIRNRGRPQRCGFKGFDALVCCMDSVARITMPPRTITFHPLSKPEEGCGPVSTNLTSPKTGQKAWDKCIEYQERLIYPCEKSVALGESSTRGKHCLHNVDELIVGGSDCHKGEFPHMVLLGFGDTIETANWECGGSLISEWFILTATHCTAHMDFGPVNFAAVGLLRRSDTMDSSNVYNIISRHKHPQYNVRTKYNDIALLKTERQIVLGLYVVPACLDVGKELNYTKALATGWGLLEDYGTHSNTLQKVKLTKFTDEICTESFLESRLLGQGFNLNLQLCYGDHTTSKDTCRGDSGGPLQLKRKSINCMYSIIGVTSLGRACGYPGEPAIYTKVEPYVPWIESIVWP